MEMETKFYLHLWRVVVVFFCLPSAKQVNCNRVTLMEWLILHTQPNKESVENITLMTLKN